MSRPSRQPLIGFILVAILGGLIGTLLPRPKVLITGPAPYQVPRTFGGTALRMAMVHDVLHQRYPRHSEAYYEDRIRRVTKRLAESSSDEPSLEELALLDDLSAALDHLGRAEEAVETQLRKLELLRRHFPEALADTPPPFFDDAECIGATNTEEAMRRVSLPDPAPARMSAYRTHANLGTHLIHASLRAALQGDASERRRLEQGLEHIRTAIGIRPGAHFGREEWQVNAVETLLAHMDGDGLRYDLFGNDLKADLSRYRRRRLDLWGHRPLHVWHVERAALDQWMAGPEASPDGRERGLEPAARIRRAILRIQRHDEVGFDERESDPWPLHHRYPDGVAFDEPTLAILGMWMLGGGPNPHFALALGGIMEQIGQRHLAWAAYARALDLGGDEFAHAEHCRKRLVAIELALAATGGPDPRELRALFDKELAEGKAWQAAYQEYEAERIAAGDDPSAPGFYDEFERRHGSIATPPGPEDTLRVMTSRPPGGLPFSWEMALLGAGIGGFLGSLVGPRKGSRPKGRWSRRVARV